MYVQLRMQATRDIIRVGDPLGRGSYATRGTKCRDKAGCDFEWRSAHRDFDSGAAAHPTEEWGVWPLQIGPHQGLQHDNGSLYAQASLDFAEVAAW